MAPRTVAQYIRVIWTKASRGNPAASRRNAVPQAFELPADILESAEPTQVHALQVRELNDFVPARKADRWAGDGSQLLRIGCACIALEATGLHLWYEYDEAHAGRPFRRYYDATGTLTSVKKDVGLLSPGEWARIQWNGRFLLHADWWYELCTVNVAFVEDLSPDFFLTASPAVTYSKLADLH